MTTLTIWKAPKVRVGPVGGFLLFPLDDTQAPYCTTRLAFRPCGNGILRLHAARTLFGRENEWWALVLRPADGSPEQMWCYRDELKCREVYAIWAGYGDPDGFAYSPTMYQWGNQWRMPQ
jgi:hypothetical protein